MSRSSFRKDAAVLLVLADEETRSSKHLQCRGFDPPPQDFVQTVARHDVGLAAENAGCLFFYVHQFEQAELSSFVGEEQIDIGSLARGVAGGRTEQVEALDPEPPQFGFVLLQFGDGLVAVHQPPRDPAHPLSQRSFAASSSAFASTQRSPCGVSSLFQKGA